MRVLPILLALLFAGCAAHRFAAQRLGPLPPPERLGIDDSTVMRLDPERIELTREYFRIHAPALELKPPFEMQPRVVVVHYTAVPTLEGTLRVFRAGTIDRGRGQVAANGRLNVGIQFVVDRDGKIYRLFPETTITRHVIGLNHVAIGIENVGGEDISSDQLRGRTGNDGNGRQLTPAQLDANVALIRALKARHPGLEWVIGHQEYRDFEHPAHPGRALFVEAVPGYRTEKIDPGKRFMAELRRRLKAAGDARPQGK
jgi:N-acetyl-anhydromuramyl-L-alanine amidase AmpD